MSSEAYIVILCGGGGTRLWPVSRPSRPKQFAELVGSESLFLHTARRALAGVAGRKLLIVAGRAHEAAIAAQLAEAGLEGTILIEPEARDSGPAIAAAAAYLAAHSPEAVMFVLASDHYIPDAHAFQASLTIAQQAAQAGLIATLGILPRHPSTAYGYIRPEGAPVADQYTPIREFREKPDRATAEQFVSEGYLWNSGNFVAKAGVLFAAFERFEPALASASREAAAESRREGRSVRLGPSFHAAKKISIDFAVMERTDNACVVPVAWEWSDLGAWDAVHNVSPTDADGNLRQGKTVLLDTRNSLVRAMPGMVVATSGISDLAVIADRDAVLVCRLDASQSVKQIVDALKAEGHPAIDLPPDGRPADLAGQAAEWGDWLRHAALPLWWCLGADHLNGGFRELIALDGAPTGDIRRCRVQSRQAYVYALAGARGWEGPWRAAVMHGIEALERFHRRPDGLYRTMVDNRGAMLDDTAKLYDQAFVLLALSAARTVFPDAEARANRLLGVLESMRHGRAGFRENEAEVFQSNPHMHLFEACLAWIEAGGDERWRDLAAEIAALARLRFMDPESGALREFFDAEWNPAPGAAGQRVEPGHQFEWAWLMERWARLSGDPEAAKAAERLFQAGRRGVDARRGVAMNAVDPRFTPLDSGARLWPQTEWIKAATLLAQRPEGVEGASPLDIRMAVLALRPYLETGLRGLWRDKLQADGAFVTEPAPASSLYHIIGAIIALEDATRT